jgi:hypothetical protein
MGHGTRILDYVTDREEFHLVRDKDCVHASYFAYFDRDTDETTDITVSFPLEDYTRGIEKLLTEGKCSINTPTATMRLEKRSDESVQMYLLQKNMGFSYSEDTLIDVDPKRFLNGF